MDIKWFALPPMIAGAFLIFALSSCSVLPKRVEVVRPNFVIPPQMLECDDGTPRPNGEQIMESDVARYISGLEFSKKDCKTRLKEISIIIKCYNDKDCNVDKLAEYMGLVRDTSKR